MTQWINFFKNKLFSAEKREFINASAHILPMAPNTLGLKSDSSDETSEGLEIKTQCAEDEKMLFDFIEKVCLNKSMSITVQHPYNFMANRTVLAVLATHVITNAIKPVSITLKNMSTKFAGYNTIVGSLDYHDCLEYDEDNRSAHYPTKSREEIQNFVCKE